HVMSAPAFFEHLVSVIGLAREVGRQARPAIAEFARGSDRYSVALQHLGDRLACAHFVIAAGFCQSHAKWLVLRGSRLRAPGEGFVMLGAGRPIACCLPDRGSRSAARISRPGAGSPPSW